MRMIVVQQLKMPNKIFRSIRTASVLVPEHLVLWAEDLSAQRTRSRCRDVDVRYVRTQLSKWLVADLADAAVVGWAPADCILGRSAWYMDAASMKTTNPMPMANCQAASNNNTAWNNTEVCNYSFSVFRVLVSWTSLANPSYKVGIQLTA